MTSNNFPKKFVSTLLGKKEELVKEEKQGPSISNMLKGLMGIGDEAWGQYAFKREPLRGKFNLEEKQELIEKANACGKQYARKMRQKYGDVDMYVLAEKLGLEVDYPERPNGGSHIIFAQFVAPNQVTVFKDSVHKADELIAKQKLEKYFVNRDGAAVKIEEILIAHEIFHFIEEHDEEIFTKSEKIRLWKVGPIKNDSEVVCLGEIAGMAFAKELLNLSYSPYILDSFLVYLYHPQVAYGLYEEIMGIQNA